MKKLFAICLLIISIACSVIPCCQFDDCAAEQALSEQSNHQEEEQEGSCSPFFSCTTCSGFIQITKAIQLPQFFIEKQIHFTTASANNLSDYNSSFWQPPRFA